MTKDIENKSSLCMYIYPRIEKKKTCNGPTTNHNFQVSKFENILPDLFIVYEHTNKYVLTSEILPVDFYQENPMKIVSSLQSHTTTDVTSIENKFKNGQYSTPYQLFHDIKAVASILLNKEVNGSLEYKELDFFYKFSTELLLREVGNLIKFNNETAEIKTELETQLDEDFTKIITNYNISNGEVITYISTTEESETQSSSVFYQHHQHKEEPTKKTQPLFSSVVSKSELDNRATIVPSPYRIAQVVPSIKDSVSENTLETLSPITNRIPSPLDQPTNILHDFFHPTWYTISVPTWLTYTSQTIKPANFNANQELEDGAGASTKTKLSILKNRDNDFSTKPTNIWGPGNYYRSFAPSRNSSGSIVGNKLKANVWLQHIGMTEIAELKQSFVENTHETSPLVNDTVPDKEDGSESKSNTENGSKPTNGQQIRERAQEPAEENPSPQNINIANIIKWDPTKVEELNYLKEHKQDLVNPQKLQKMISISLLKLNKLRQERYSRSDVRNPVAPQHEENILYNRVVKLISIAIQLFNINPGCFSYQFSKNIPVLVSEFSGTLPGIPPTKAITNNGTSSNTKSNRLPNLKGPSAYRKRPTRLG
ncbi:chromatin remodeling complex subunit, putative [Candida dubliniensis CD36]|uniref:Chromatin remodeling complex subunit, putative n=1 Tax=Candida dubliniensis (strain CD36 / ATCC MYA-646 / CBS 7987 / NCPF 3949 / NRRL Y-17841) TaxID=573826 RepID=B9WAB2_CANDC|nr:chromatin remodeling complex subunit, putative [Candida dubliniensis CD36]CAX43331.1 chromatin remodeling complex subunit, putative [Candida dubliniensis CD36]